jgi:hypothetical protein
MVAVTADMVMVVAMVMVVVMVMILITDIIKTMFFATLTSVI